MLVDVASYLGKEPFANPSISRALALEDVKIILDSVSGRNSIKQLPRPFLELTYYCADGRRRRLRVDISGAKSRVRLVEKRGRMGQ